MEIPTQKKVVIFWNVGWNAQLKKFEHTQKLVIHT